MILLYLAPLVTAAVFLGALRRPPWMAGAAALLAAIPGVLAILPPGSDASGFFAHEALRGLWLAWPVIAIIAAGLFFHQTTMASGESGATPLTPQALFFTTFLLGGFMECAVGFGVNVVIVMSVLLRGGMKPLPAVLLSLFGHLFVPWGALATGTTAGAALGGESVQMLGLGSALVMAPVGLLVLPFYWHCLTLAGVSASVREKIDDALWMVLLLGLLIGAQFILPTQLAGVAALGLAAVLRRWRDGPRDVGSLTHDARQSAPYIVLCLSLLASRLIPPLKDGLQHTISFEPLAALPAYQPLYHPSLFLLIVGLGFGLSRRRDLAAAVSKTWNSGWRALLVTVLFLTLARWMSASGIAEALAVAMIDVTGPNGVILSPILGGAAGLVGGSNIASNAMMMPIQAALDGAGRLPSGTLAALQNVSGGILTALSPIRISLARALAGPDVTENEVYAAAWPFGAIAIGALCAVAAGLIFLI